MDPPSGRGQESRTIHGQDMFPGETHQCHSRSLREPVTATSLASHAEIPAAFLVESILELALVADGLGGVELTETPVGEPWVKDYDDREPPTDWVERLDVSNWSMLTASDTGKRVGGAVVAFDTPEVQMLDVRQDLAVLWDIRVAPRARGSGVGESLFRAAETSSRWRGCHTLKIETQNINVPACRFYRRMGCTLGAVNRFAYPDLPDEVQFLWFKTL